MITFFDATYPVARKIHICEYCHGPIVPKERYVRQKSVTDGSFGVWVCHTVCDSFAQKECEGDEDGIGPEDFAEALTGWEERVEELEAKYPGMKAVFERVMGGAK